MYKFLAWSIDVLLTKPFDVIKTIRQIEFIEKEITIELPGKAFKWHSKQLLTYIRHKSNGTCDIFRGLVSILK